MIAIYHIYIAVDVYKFRFLYHFARLKSENVRFRLRRTEQTELFEILKSIVVCLGLMAFNHAYLNHALTGLCGVISNISNQSLKSGSFLIPLRKCGNRRRERERVVEKYRGIGKLTV